MKTFQTDIKNVKSTLNKHIEERRLASNIDLDMPVSQFETGDDVDPNFNILSQQITQDEEPAEIENLLFSESNVTPNFEIWDSLQSLTLNENQCTEVELIPMNRFFEIPKSGSAFGTVNMLFDLIRPEGDKTKILKLAFKYGKNRSNGVLYLFIMCMTNKSTRRDKNTPFVFEYVIPCTLLDPSIKSQSIEGFCQIKPKKGCLHDEIASRKKIKFTNEDRNIRKTIVDTFTRDFPVDHAMPATRDTCENAQPVKYDREIKPNTYVIIKIKDVKNPSLARVITITTSEVLFEILKPKAKSPLKYFKDPVKTIFYGRQCILASNIPVYEESDTIVSLYQKPREILNDLNLE